MGRIYFLIFWAPAVTSGLTLLVAWSSGMLRRPAVGFAVFVTALLLQATAGLFSPAWAVGLVLQTALAVYLCVRLKLG